MRSNRDISLDAVKGLVVIFMIIQHFSVWLWFISWSDIPALIQAHPLYYTAISLSAVSAPLFIFTAGMGAYLLMNGRGTTKIILYRGFVLIALGYIMNITVSSWWSYGSWYVLHLIGFSFLLVPLLMRLRRSLLPVLVFTVLAGGFILQNILNTPLAFGNYRMANMNLPLAPLRMAFAEGHFPVFPWIAFFITGFLCAKPFIEYKTKTMLMSGIALLSSGISLSAAGLFIPSLSNGRLYRLFTVKADFYPMLTSTALMLLGGSILIIIIVRMLCTKLQLTESNPIAGLGRISLTVFITHAYVKQLVYATHTNQSFSEAAAIAASISIILLYCILEHFWKKTGYRFGAEWLLRLVK